MAQAAFLDDASIVGDGAAGNINCGALAQNHVTGVCGQIHGTAGRHILAHRAADQVGVRCNIDEGGAFTRIHVNCLAEQRAPAQQRGVFQLLGEQLDCQLVTCHRYAGGIYPRHINQRLLT